MSKIMESNPSHAVFFEDCAEVCGDEPRLNPFTKFIDIDVLGIFRVIATAACLAVFFLLRSHAKE